MMALVFVVPLLWPVLRSFEPQSLVTAPPSAQDFTHLTLANYRLLFGGSIGILRYMLNSGIVVLGTILLTTVLATLGGLGFGRYKFKGQTLVFLLILSPLMIPFQAILTPLFIEMHDLHLLNNLQGLIVAYTTLIPVGVFVMRNTFPANPSGDRGVSDRQRRRDTRGPPEGHAPARGSRDHDGLRLYVPLLVDRVPRSLDVLDEPGPFHDANCPFEHRKWDLRPGELSVLEAGAVIAAVPAIVVSWRSGGTTWPAALPAGEGLVVGRWQATGDAVARGR